MSASRPSAPADVERDARFGAPRARDHHLRYFVHVAELGSVSAAARSIGIAQPTLSTALQRLQRDLGLTLFRPSGHGLSLTPAGEDLLAVARESVRAADEFTARARRLAAGEAGTVTVAVTAGAAIAVLAPLLRVFALRHPRAQVRILRSFAIEAPVAALRESRADVALVPRLPVPDDLEGFPVGAYELALAVPAGTRMPAGRVGTEHLHGLQMIGSRPGTAANRILDSARAAGGEPRVVLVEPEIAALPQLVGEGLGSAVVVTSMEPQLRAVGARVRLFERPERWQVSLLHRGDRLPSAAQRFAEAARHQRPLPSAARDAGLATS